MEAGSRMQRHAQRDLKSSAVPRIPLRHGHPPRPEDVVGRIGPVRAAGRCRGALEMGWRDCWRPWR
eukprot:scaffold104992_cov35-Phaeocystis_antarctica.AAC.1